MYNTFKHTHTKHIHIQNTQETPRHYIDTFLQKLQMNDNKCIEN